MLVLTVEVVDQLWVSLPTGGPGHGPGKEQSHECEHSAGQQTAHPTATDSSLPREGTDKQLVTGTPEPDLSLILHLQY